jgi:SAM-dependent methyltransferase
MDSSVSYVQHWNDPRFNKIFLGFKAYIFTAEKQFATKVAEAIHQYLPSKPLAILDVGAGDGIVSLAFLENLSQYCQVGTYTGFDISPDLTEILASRKNEFNDLVGQFSCFQADASSFESRDQFDLIVSFNSWYGIPFTQVRKYQEMLSKGGVLAILLNSKQSITVDLTRQFIEPMTTAEDLEGWLQQNNISYTTLGLRSKLLSKSNFISDGNLITAAEPFYRYLLRRISGSLGDISWYLDQKSEQYFQIPQKLFVILK